MGTLTLGCLSTASLTLEAAALLHSCDAAPLRLRAFLSPAPHTCAEQAGAEQEHGGGSGTDAGVNVKSSMPIALFCGISNLVIPAALTDSVWAAAAENMTSVPQSRAFIQRTRSIHLPSLCV